MEFREQTLNPRDSEVNPGSSRSIHGNQIWIPCKDKNKWSPHREARVETVGGRKWKVAERHLGLRGACTEESHMKIRHPTLRQSFFRAVEGGKKKLLILLRQKVCRRCKWTVLQFEVTRQSCELYLNCSLFKIRFWMACTNLGNFKSVATANWQSTDNL